MPDVLVEARGSWLDPRKHLFFEAINASLVEAIRTPPGDTVLRLTQHASEDFVIPQGADEKFTRIEITMFAGRSVDAKRALYRAIGRNLEPFGMPVEDIKVVLVEVPAEDVGMRGGRAACDIDLGYEVRV